MSRSSARRSCLVIAHRGASAHRPENTMAAYELACEQRADMLEIDLHLTRDGAVVVSHDSRLEHFGRTGEIGELTLEEVRELDAGEGLGVPTLDEVLSAFGRRVPINLELKKPERGLYDGLEEVVLRSVRAHGVLDRILFSSFFDPVLEELRRLSAGARLAALAHVNSPGDPVERARRVGAEAVNPHFSIATPELAARLADAGLAWYSYTVDNEEKMAELIDRGAAGLFTNRPDVMRKLVDCRAG